MKVAFVGYRDWALKIFDNLLRDTRFPFVDVGEADIVLYYGWSDVIPKEIYENKLCLILHPSPLPKYRGGSPLQHQIMNGEKESAVTILKVGKKIDTGDIYSQTTFSLEGSLDDIFKRIINIGTRDTIKILNDITNNKAKTYTQVESKATTFKRRKPEESELKLGDFKRKTSKQLYDFIRALNDPYPNAYIKCKDGKKLYLIGAHL